MYFLSPTTYKLKGTKWWNQCKAYKEMVSAQPWLCMRSLLHRYGGSHSNMESQLLAGKCYKPHSQLLWKGRSNPVFKPGMVQQAGGAIKCTSTWKQLLWVIWSRFHCSSTSRNLCYGICHLKSRPNWVCGYTCKYSPTHTHISFIYIFLYTHTSILMFSTSEEKFKQAELKLNKN